MSNELDGQDCDICDNSATKVLCSETSKWCASWFRGWYCDECCDEVEAEMKKIVMKDELMSNIHPTSKLIFDFLHKTGMRGEDLYPFLRLFIANEYDNDNTVAERLAPFLDEVAEAWEDTALWMDMRDRTKDPLLDGIIDESSDVEKE
jgi:hypothetical protein